MIIRLMARKDLDAVVRLHKKILPETLTSKIGKSYIFQLYDALLNSRNLHYCLVAENQKKIVGAITATYDLAKTQNILKSMFSVETIFMVLKAIFSGKISVFELYQKARFERVLVTKFNKPYATILTLFVANDYQKRGIGKKLVKKIGKNFIDRRLRYLYVDTLKTNMNAFLFYKKIRFREQKTVFDSIILKYNLV